MKLKSKKAIKSALNNEDANRSDTTTLISSGYTEDSSNDESGSDQMTSDEEDHVIEEVSDSDSEGSNIGESDYEDAGSESDSKEAVGSNRTSLDFVPSKAISGVNLSDNSAELKQRLRDAINARRKIRKVAPLDVHGRPIAEDQPFSKRRAKKEKESGKTTEEIKESKRQKKNAKKRLRKEEALKKHQHAPKTGIESDEDSSDAEDMKPVTKKRKVEENLDFGKVEFYDGHSKRHFENQLDDRGKRVKKLTKEQELKKLQREKERMNDGTEEGERVAESKAWSKSFQRMEGHKVKDRMDLLKKSIKRDESHKKKSRKEWKEREEKTKKTQDERQQKRKENIAKRVATIKLNKGPKLRKSK